MRRIEGCRKTQRKAGRILRPDRSAVHSQTPGSFRPHSAYKTQWDRDLSHRVCEGDTMRFPSSLGTLSHPRTFPHREETSRNQGSQGRPTRNCPPYESATVQRVRPSLPGCPRSQRFVRPHPAREAASQRRTGRLVRAWLAPRNYADDCKQAFAVTATHSQTELDGTRGR